MHREESTVLKDIKLNTIIVINGLCLQLQSRSPLDLYHLYIQTHGRENGDTFPAKEVK